jgi:hypothetical protein
MDDLPYPQTTPASLRRTPPTPRADAFDDSLHALPAWFAAFQKTCGLSFLILASAYLLGNLATLGWVPNIDTPAGWGLFRGAGVVIFFLAGVAVAGIGLTCSVVFVGALKRRHAFMALTTGLGMLLFFGVEVWASLSERSTNIHPTPADLAVLQALGIKGVPPISPTAVVVALLFPLGSLFFGFVQQRRTAVTEQDLAEDALEMERKIRLAELRARLAEADGKKHAAQARGAIGAIRAGVQAARSSGEDGADRQYRQHGASAASSADVITPGGSFVRQPTDAADSDRSLSEVLADPFA